MIRWLCATVAEAILSGFAFLLLTGKYISEGRVVATLTRDHGLHSGDLFVIGGWVVATAAIVALVLPRRTRANVRGSRDATRVSDAR